MISIFTIFSQNTFEFHFHDNHIFFNHDQYILPELGLKMHNLSLHLTENGFKKKKKKKKKTLFHS